MIPEYSYRVTDRSLLTPPFKRTVVAPLMRFVPLCFPANLITLASCLLPCGALAVVLWAPFGRGPSGVVAAVLLLAYAIGDHVDGMQAKRTATSTPLGELCDHYGDAFITGLVSLVLLEALEVRTPTVVAAFLLSNYLAHSALFFEQHKTGWLVFERIGSLEGVFVAVAVLLVDSLAPVHQVLVTAQVAGVRMVEILLVGAAVGGLWTWVRAIARARIVEGTYWTFCLALTTVGITAQRLPETSLIPGGSVGGLIVTLYAAAYVGDLLRGHLADRRTRSADIVTPVVLVFAVILPPAVPRLGPVLIVGLAARAAYVGLAGLVVLRQFWYWRNPTVTLAPSPIEASATAAAQGPAAIPSVASTEDPGGQA